MSVKPDQLTVKPPIVAFETVTDPPVGLVLSRTWTPVIVCEAVLPTESKTTRCAFRVAWIWGVDASIEVQDAPLKNEEAVSNEGATGFGAT